MNLQQLAGRIYSFRNSDQPSSLLLPPSRDRATSDRPIGVLLLKPSSGRIPVESIVQILQRLTAQFGYEILSVAWWSGRDIRSHLLMSRHYPGFHRVAHQGLSVLSPGGKERLVSVYGKPGGLGSFHQAFGVPFEWAHVRIPFDLVARGMSADALNALWESERTSEPPVKQIQRLDEDSFALAVRFSDEAAPATLRGQTVILLNGFFAKLEQDFEAKGCIAIVIERGAGTSVSWEDLRAKYAGKTNPFQAPPGTIRGDAAQGALEVETVSILANVIHLSANESEGRREVEEVWWEPARVRAVFGC